VPTFAERLANDLEQPEELMAVTPSAKESGATAIRCAGNRRTARAGARIRRSCAVGVRAAVRVSTPIVLVTLFSTSSIIVSQK